MWCRSSTARRPLPCKAVWPQAAGQSRGEGQGGESADDMHVANGPMRGAGWQEVLAAGPNGGGDEVQRAEMTD